MGQGGGVQQVHERSSESGLPRRCRGAPTGAVVLGVPQLCWQRGPWQHGGGGLVELLWLPMWWW
jgi:hypothetical protein